VSKRQLSCVCCANAGVKLKKLLITSGAGTQTFDDLGLLASACQHVTRQERCRLTALSEIAF
jgi:hypothetical protein